MFYTFATKSGNTKRNLQVSFYNYLLHYETFIIFATKELHPHSYGKPQRWNKCSALLAIVDKTTCVRAQTTLFRKLNLVNLNL